VENRGGGWRQEFYDCTVPYAGLPDSEGLAGGILRRRPDRPLNSALNSEGWPETFTPASAWSITSDDADGIKIYTPRHMPF
jgi:hypothetical protein